MLSAAHTADVCMIHSQIWSICKLQRVKRCFHEQHQVGQDICFLQPAHWSSVCCALAEFLSFLLYERLHFQLNLQLHPIPRHEDFIFSLSISFNDQRIVHKSTWNPVWGDSVVTKLNVFCDAASKTVNVLSMRWTKHQRSPGLPLQAHFPLIFTFSLSMFHIFCTCFFF